MRVKHSNWCVDVQGAWTHAGAPVIHYPCQNPPHANEMWLEEDSAPPYAHSWYITNPNSNAMYDLGRYTDGPLDNLTCANSLVVLNFGQPDYVSGNYGTRYHAYPYPFINSATVRIAVENYARGWWDATSTCPRLSIVVGTSNYNQIPSGGGTEYGAGYNWATLVYSIQNYLITQGYSGRITAWAGSDMEQPGEGQLWDCAGPTRQFVDGYNANSLARKFINYGTAWLPNACWTVPDVYHVSWGAPKNYPLPEAYTGPAVDSWIAIRQAYYMYFEGVMTSCNQGDLITGEYCVSPGTFFAPTKAWFDLWYKLYAYGVGQPSMDFATNIRYQ